jgi:hypothetical protein
MVVRVKGFGGVGGKGRGRSGRLHARASETAVLPLISGATWARRDSSSRSDAGVWFACRMDLLVTANQPVGNYWVSANPQYRTGMPNGVLPAPTIMHLASLTNPPMAHLPTSTSLGAPPTRFRYPPLQGCPLGPPHHHPTPASAGASLDLRPVEPGGMHAGAFLPARAHYTPNVMCLHIFSHNMQSVVCHQSQDKHMVCGTPCIAFCCSSRSAPSCLARRISTTPMLSIRRWQPG